MKKYQLLLMGLVLVAFSMTLVNFKMEHSKKADNNQPKPDLAIGLHSKLGRPNVFIAWRNSERILEVEVEVKNYSEVQASGYLTLYILNEEGEVLDYSPKGDQEKNLVTLPPYTKGGAEGKIIQSHGSKELNLLIDRLDRINAKYYLKAHINTIGNEENEFNNTVVKSFNVSARIRPGSEHFYDYYFKNNSNKTKDIIWSVKTSKLPTGWLLETHPSNGQKLSVKPGEVVQGVAVLKTSKVIKEGEYFDVRFAALHEKDNSFFGQSEWYLVYDNTAPEISDIVYEVQPNKGILTVSMAANDITSMIKEASGARVDYTVDGVTFSSKVLAYKDGNFVGPTRFGADLGGFSDGTNLEMYIVVEDIAGNVAKEYIGPIKIDSKKALIEKVNVVNKKVSEHDSLFHKNNHIRAY